MKLKTTKTAIKKGYYNIISIGYCDLQNLLSYKNAFAYNAGVYGWNCDFYDVDGVCISTGYRPLNDVNTKFDYEIVRRYENEARSIKSDICDYETKVKLMNELLIKFVNECIK